MPLDPRIARLGPDDVPVMRALNALFARMFEDDASYLGAPPADDYLVSILARNTVFALVALAGETVVGGLVAYELAKLEQARSEIYIYDLAVDIAHRRRGIATGLIRHLQGIARARGAWVTYVQADYGDEPAIALYEKLGVREDVMHFDLRDE